MTEESGKGWTLQWGAHKRSLMSRDIGYSIKGLISLKECQIKAEELKKELADVGMYFWFVYAISPNGQRHHFHDLEYPL